MQKWLIKILVCAVNVFILAYILPGIEIKDMLTALIVAVVLSFLDAVIKPLLILLTLPATVFTLGLFLCVINACIILNKLNEKYFYDTINVIKTITAEELRELAKKYLNPEDFYELIVI